MDVSYLIQKMQAANLPILTLREDGSFEMAEGATAEEAEQVQAIVDAYDPLVVLKVKAEAQVNFWANQAVMSLKILEPELFYVAMVSNIAFRLLVWNSLGKPEVPDPTRFVVTYSEAQAYSETSQPGMTAADLLRLQESRWTAMQTGFAAIVYKRRLALERIKLAQSEADIETALAGLA